MSSEMENRNLIPKEEKAEGLAPDRDIRLTVVRPGEEENELKIDLYAIGQGLKRFLAMWLVLAIVLGLVGTGVGLLVRKGAYVGGAAALITLEGSSAKASDITVLQTSRIVGEAMTSLGLDLKNLDTVRKNLSITGILSEKDYDEMSLYQGILSKTTGAAAIDAADAMLSVSRVPSRYLIRLDYSGNGLNYSRETGIMLLDEIIDRYRDYVEKNFNRNTALGNAVAAVDYTDYDYAEAVQVFTNQLTAIQTYLRDAIAHQTTVFRSKKTGSTMQDLLTRAGMVRSIELSKVSSFVTLNSVTKRDPQTEAAHYEYLIEEIDREIAVLRKRSDSLSASVSVYEKDPVVYTSVDDAAQETAHLKMNDSRFRASLDAYDTMILDLIQLQEQMSEKNRIRNYYQSIIDRLKAKDSILEENNRQAEEGLESLSGLVNGLIADVNATVAEYYSDAVKENTVQIQVPASGRTPSLTDGGWLRILIILEVLLLLAYLATAAIWGLRKANPRRGNA